MPPSPISPSRVSRLAESLGHGGNQGELDPLVRRVGAEIDGYARLDSIYGEPPRPGAPQSITIRPGADADPLNAFLATFRLSGADRGPLSGYDVAVKDNVAVAGVPMTCGSRVFEAATPDGHATVVDRLREAGAAIVAKTNMDELAYGPTSETSQFGPVRNPSDRDHVAGGSSSGSAAAVAAGSVDIALGTDTGGSVRIPSSLCGVVGVKPSYGAVSRSGVVDLAPSLDHVGPLARDVETAAAALDAMTGFDSRDPITGRANLSSASAAAAVADSPALADCTFGLPQELFADHVDRAVEDRVREVADDLTAAGATVEPVSLPMVPDLAAVWKAIVNVELATTFLTRGAPVARRHAVDVGWYDAAADAVAEREHAFGETVRAMTIAGAHLLDRDGGKTYTRALALRERFADSVDDTLSEYDALLSPTTPATAPRLDEDGDERRVPLAYNTRPADLASVPAVSLPAGAVDGLPLGVQLYGRRDEDAALLGVARTVERVL